MLVFFLFGRLFLLVFFLLHFVFIQRCHCIINDKRWHYIKVPVWKPAACCRSLQQAIIKISQDDTCNISKTTLRFRRVEARVLPPSHTPFFNQFSQHVIKRDFPKSQITSKITLSTKWGRFEPFYFWSVRGKWKCKEQSAAEEERVTSRCIHAITISMLVLYHRMVN